MTDFLDQLEADLRAAAQRPRRRHPAPAVKTLAVVAAVALLVVAGVRVVDRDTTEQSAGPTPTPTSQPAPVTDRTPIAIATSGDPRTLDLLERRLMDADYRVIASPDGSQRRADPSLGSVVLYRPAGEALAEDVARDTGIRQTAPLTDAEEAEIHYDLLGAPVVAVVGTDMQAELLSEAERCTPAGTVTGGALELCTRQRRGTAVSRFLVDGRPLAVDRMSRVGHWRWAAASPDGRTILAQWSAECEVPEAVLISADGGTPRRIAGAGSEALGWATDGRAIVFRRPGGGCTDGADPGLYLVTTDGEATRIGSKRVEPSLEPRAVQAVEHG